MFLRALSHLYGWGVHIRNFAYDKAWLKSRAFDFPVICLGNLRVGGTGKSPICTELARHLAQKGHRVGVLSRGYGRLTRGYMEVALESRDKDCGDEARERYLLLRDQDRILQVVCEDRVHALERMRNRCDVVLMDDGFQHRAVQPSLGLVLHPAGELPNQGRLLPAGRLREPWTGLNRAHALILTGAGHTEAAWSSALKALPKNYSRPGKPTFAGPVFTVNAQAQPALSFKAMLGDNDAPNKLPQGSPVVLVTAMARPERILQQIQGTYKVQGHFNFRDHYPLGKKELRPILAEQERHPGSVVLTSLKDAVKMEPFLGTSEFRDLNVYFVPITFKPEELLPVKDWINEHIERFTGNR